MSTKRIIVCEPGKQPEVREVEELNLETMQGIVGGLIQCISLSRDIDLWINEEGRLRHLPFNRTVKGEDGSEWDVVGPMFICTAETGDDPEDGDRTEGLSDMQILAWSQRLTLPEVKVVTPPEGTVAVYHALHPNFAGSYMWDIQPPPPWPTDFRLVALVLSPSLDTAYEKTNHIDRAWQENPQVKAMTDRARSSSVGDVFVTADGKAHRVDSCGFVEVGQEAKLVADTKAEREAEVEAGRIGEQG